MKKFLVFLACSTMLSSCFKSTVPADLADSLSIEGKLAQVTMQSSRGQVMKVESLDQLEKAYIVWRKRHVREAVPDELIDRTHHAAAHFGGTAVSRAIKIDWQ